jgi:hypothetical protein
LKPTLILLLVCACGGFQGGVTPPAPPAPAPPAPEAQVMAASGGQKNTFDHETTQAEARTAGDLLTQLTDEGPAEVSGRMHSCAKLKVRALRGLLGSRGVDVSGDGPVGRALAGGATTLGAAHYDDRVAEAVTATTAGLVKQFDIFVLAAPELIANIGKAKACQLRSAPAQLFDAAGRCDASGITCLLGVPASDAHLALCNRAVAQASSREVGKNLAVAALLAAGHTCE